MEQGAAEKEIVRAARGASSFPRGILLRIIQKSREKFHQTSMSKTIIINWRT
jgi:hypothetical protein